MLEPKVSQMLFFHVASSEPKDHEQEYKSRIEDEDEDHLFIEVPIHIQTGKNKKLFLGEELSCLFINENGIKHYFNTHVTGFVNENLPLVKLIKPNPEKMTKIQRRNFFRISAEVEIAVKNNKGERFVLKTDDIGGGGVAFFANKNQIFQLDEKLDCWTLLSYRNGTIEHAHFIAEIVRIEELESGRQLIMLEFLHITEIERQKIIRFVFERQMEFKNR